MDAVMVRKLVFVVMSVLTVGTAFAWCASYWRPTKVEYFTDGQEPRIVLNRNLPTTQVWRRYAPFWHVSVEKGDLEIFHGEYILSGTFLVSEQTSHFGFRVSRSYYSPNWVISRTYGIPMWAPTILFLAYPVLTIVRSPRVRRRHRQRHGLCLYCGYDLRGNMSGACPECGRAFQSEVRPS